MDGYIEIWTLDFTELNSQEVDVQQFALKLCGAWLSEQGNEDFYIGGYSIGFRIAFFMALRFKNKKLKLINLDGIIFKNKEEEQMLDQNFKNDFEEENLNSIILKDQLIDEEPEIN